MKEEEKNSEERGLDSFIALPFKTYEELIENRLILLNGEVKENIIEKAVVPILQMTKDSKTQLISILINSFGGTSEDSQAVVDVIRSTPCHVQTIVLGKAMSAAFDIFLAGDERVVYENSILMCHSGTENSGTKPLPFLKIDAKLHEEYIKRWAKFYASRTSVTYEKWFSMLESGKDFYFFPEEAVRLGIAHTIKKASEKKNATTNKKRRRKNKRIRRRL